LKTVISQNHTCCDVDDDHDHHHRKCNYLHFSDFQDLGISGTWLVRRTWVCAPTESLCDYVLRVTSVAKWLKGVKTVISQNHTCCNDDDDDDDVDVT